MSTIALLTDFGTADIYVGVMKAVMQRVNPLAAFIDVTHQIEPQNVRQAALALMNSVRYFAPGTTFLVVVDPGVGSTRRPIAAQVDAEHGRYTFVAPDNGVLSYALAELGQAHAVELTHKSYQLAEVSATFHGRDVFAPAAAHLAAGVRLEEFGALVEDLVKLPAPELSLGDRRIRGEVMHIDRFGNILTSIGELRWRAADRLVLEPRFGERGRSVPVPAENITVKLNGKSVNTIEPTYSEAERGQMVALVGSNGFLEIAVNQGSAAALLKAEIGDRVDLVLAIE